MEIHECNENLVLVGFRYNSQFANFNAAMQYRVLDDGDSLFEQHVNNEIGNDNAQGRIPLTNVRRYIVNFYTDIIDNNIECFESAVLTPREFCTNELQYSKKNTKKCENNIVKTNFYTDTNKYKNVVQSYELSINQSNDAIMSNWKEEAKQYYKYHIKMAAEDSSTYLLF